MDEQIKQLAVYADRLTELVKGDILCVRIDNGGKMDILTLGKPDNITDYTSVKREDNEPMYRYYCEAQIADNCKVSWFEHEEDNHETV